MSSGKNIFSSILHLMCYLIRPLKSCILAFFVCSLLSCHKDDEKPTAELPLLIPKSTGWETVARIPFDQTQAHTWIYPPPLRDITFQGDTMSVIVSDNSQRSLRLYQLAKFNINTLTNLAIPSPSSISFNYQLPNDLTRSDPKFIPFTNIPARLITKFGYNANDGSIADYSIDRADGVVLPTARVQYNHYDENRFYNPIGMEGVRTRALTGQYQIDPSNSGYQNAIALYTKNGQVTRRTFSIDTSLGEPGWRRVMPFSTKSNRNYAVLLDVDGNLSIADLEQYSQQGPQLPVIVASAKATALALKWVNVFHKVLDNQVIIMATNFKGTKEKMTIEVFSWREGELNLKYLYQIPLDYIYYLLFYLPDLILDFDEQGRFYLAKYRVNDNVADYKIANGDFIRIGPEGETKISGNLNAAYNGITEPALPVLKVHKNFIYSAAVSRDTTSSTRRIEIIRRPIP